MFFRCFLKFAKVQPNVFIKDAYYKNIFIIYFYIICLSKTATSD